KKNNGHVKMSLKEMAMHVVKSGDIKILPDRFNKTYFHWMENLHDWCISRQIWFGHRIPVWYDKNDRAKFVVAVKSPGKNYEQDPDTLDTWFSSSLWTFSTLLDKPLANDTLDSWISRNKQKGKDLQMFHPTSVLETAYDILFFWVARMILMTTYIMGEIPFKTVYLHGLVRDKQGRKMSKSLDNGIDPLDMVNQFGADATRLALVIGTAPGGDSRLYEEKIAGYRNFVNKIWNIARFILISNEKKDVILEGGRMPTDRIHLKNTGSYRSASASLQDDKLTLADEWILSRLQNLIHDVTDHFEKYEFSPAGEKIYDFLWHELADWYVEISKSQDHSIAPEILLDAIKLLHPFTPFVTEHIFQLLKQSGLIKSNDKFLAISSWPKANPKLRKLDIESDFAIIQELVATLRDLRSTHNLPYSEKLDAALTTKNYKDLFQEQELVVEQLTKIRIQVLPTKPVNQENFIREHKNDFDIYLKLSRQTIAEQEKRITKERANLEQYVKSLEAKLANKNFIKNAPKEVVGKEKVKLKQTQARLSRHSKLDSESNQ
ncbi:MAG: class I tRNA ligase family protein, partial [Candidatus Komeilibacteria bacterium]|nr:class I tRNA ligase family protein [Candidatus Komeilibacteria bacterium]